MKSKLRINSTLKAFVEGWNNRAVTTQLLTCGYLVTSNSETFQSDDEYPTDSFINLDVNTVYVPQTDHPYFTASQMNEMHSIIARSSDIGDYGVETYKILNTAIKDIMSDPPQY